MWEYYFLLFQINVFVNHLNGYLSVETEITWFSQALGTLLFFLLLVGAGPGQFFSATFPYMVSAMSTIANLPYCPIIGNLY